MKLPRPQNSDLRTDAVCSNKKTRDIDLQVVQVGCIHSMRAVHILIIDDVGQLYELFVFVHFV